MPRDKDRKRIIRDRMKKTGESCTTARSHGSLCRQYLMLGAGTLDL